MLSPRQSESQYTIARRIEYDRPLDFDSIKCRICGKEDDDWRLMHFLSDGVWRTLVKGRTMREQGIDELDSSRLFCVHVCTESIFRTFTCLDQVEDYRASLNKR